MHHSVEITDEGNSGPKQHISGIELVSVDFNTVYITELCIVNTGSLLHPLGTFIQEGQHWSKCEFKE